MRFTIAQIREMKERGEKITMLTAYDYSTAKVLDDTGVQMLLVGDSLGMVMLGYESTIPVTMDDMLHHTKAVVRGTKKAHVVGDMPFMTYHTSVADALRNAARFIQEGGAQSVKLEGGENVAEVVARIVSCGIPVMGHIGLTPQSMNQLSGFKVQGKSLEAAERLMKDAIALEQAGAFSIVLEAVPAPLATLITKKVKVPTIGIGAGAACDGQVQVIGDLIGVFPDFVPKHAKQYARVGDLIKAAGASYVAEVQAGIFPTKKESYTMDESVLAELKQAHGLEG
ncbi:MAG: 3-methyl-2-oxobutanoate hydroxymethyltransferase [Dehalococcoidia bacterium]|nr:3-methyl-2-oxobutanoate hydroxymethyltransferase [Dehalococcoidia bacterium]